MSGMTMEKRVADLEKLAESMAPLPSQVGKLTERVSAVEGRLESVEGRLGSVEGRLGSVEGRLGSAEERLGSVESQIVHLRADMTAGFSAVRGEMAALKHELREDIAAQGRDTAAGFLQVGSELRGLHLKLDRLLLKGQ